MSIGVIVLAAGRGLRMRSEIPKVLHTCAGRTLLGWVLAAVEGLDPDEVTVVVGHGADLVSATLTDGMSSILQDPQNGTGHAALVGLGDLNQSHDTIVVVPGDMPLLRPESLVDLVSVHGSAQSAATVLTVEMADPAGYGRIVRDGTAITAIVEERDATVQQRSITEVNTSVYAFDGALFADALHSIGSTNDQSEQYLTDVVSVFVENGDAVSAVVVSSEEGMGVNSQHQLAEAAAALRARINRQHLDAGVWMLDPHRVYIDADITIGAGTQIYPDTYITGDAVIGQNVRLGPGVQISDSTVGDGSRIVSAVLDSATVGVDVSVGPFAYLRPGAVLADGSKVGTYVEVKNSEIGPGSKVPHLSYIGDATIGRDTNIGAATVTVNWDGDEKHRTTIGDRVKIGSDTMLVAPVTIGDDAYTGAGSVITEDVPPGSIGIERSAQKNVPDYAEKRRRRKNGETD